MFYSNYGSISCRFWDIQCRKMSWPWNRDQRSLKVTQGHWEWYHSIDLYGFQLVFFSNFVPKMHRFWDIRFQKCRDLENRVRVHQGHWKCHHAIERIRLVSIQRPWNPSKGSLKVIKNYTIQSGIHDFLLTFHSNHRPISCTVSEINADFSRKSPNFSTPMYLMPSLKGFR